MDTLDYIYTIGISFEVIAFIVIGIFIIGGIALEILSIIDTVKAWNQDRKDRHNKRHS